MSRPPVSTLRYRFGPFELCPRTAELYRDGDRIFLPLQPVSILCLLVERPGELVTREQIREALWPNTHVDYDQAINGAIRKIRQGLGDDARDPTYVETLPRLGYRFLAPVEGLVPLSTRPSRRRTVLFAVWAATLALTLTAATWSLLPVRDSMSEVPVGALEAYLRGRSLLQQDDRAAVTAARAQFEQALEQAPDFAGAHAGLAFSMIRSAKPVPHRWEIARRSLDRASELAPESGEVHALRGHLFLWVDWNRTAAETAYRRAVELSPRLPMVHEGYGVLLSLTGRREQALAKMQRAVELDPISPRTLIEAGFAHLYAGRFHQAIELCRRSMELAPASFGGYHCLSHAQRALGDLEAAHQSSLSLARVLRAPPTVIEEMQALDAEGAYVTLQRWRAATVLEKAKQGRWSWTSVGFAFAAAGKDDRALEALEKAFRRREGILLYASVDPRVDGLRDDPRFQSLLRRTGILAPDPAVRVASARATPMRTPSRF